MDTEPRALNPIPLGGLQSPRLLDRFRPSRFNTTAIVHRSFPAHLLEEDGYDIRTVQELLGHKDVTTTMIYTHVLNRGPSAVRSPADRLLAATPLPGGTRLHERAAYFERLSSARSTADSKFAAGFRPKRESASRKWAAAFAAFAVIDRTVYL